MSGDIPSNQTSTRVAIVGGGIAGATVALCLGELGLDVTLIEKGPTLVNGPPICHLHAGGNLYREISNEQCLALLAESIDLVRLYPHAVDYRPTVIAVPKVDKGMPLDNLARLKKLQDEYQRLVELDPLNRVLGKPEQYFELFSREQVEALKSKKILAKPSSLLDWLIPVAHHVDLEQLKFPIIMVQEYGLNLFRLAASAELALKKLPCCTVLTNTKVSAIESLNNCWSVTYQNELETHKEEFDYLINAAGFKSGVVDDMAGFERQRLVEFKAAYVTKWQGYDKIWPEVVFLGERGTPNGMAQFTPYPDGYFQLHGMTQSITLFNNGLVESSKASAQPQLDDHFLDKIDKGWSDNEINLRSQSAIDHLSHFIPEFAKSAIVSMKPLFGAQQIPGQDADLRAAGVSFEGNHYARCEIVKASSVLSVADEIIKQLIHLDFLDLSHSGSREFSTLSTIVEKDITEHALSICESRHYPKALANRNIKGTLL